MELTELRSFVVVAEELNFNRAADRLHITQPALSQRIRNLERDIGAPLFERSTKQVSLTEVGEGLLGSVRNLLTDADRIQTQADYLRRQNTGMLTLAHTRSAGAESTAALLGEFKQAHPEVAMETSMGFTKRNIERVLSGELDVAFARAYSAEGAALSCLTLWSDPVVVAIPARHRLASHPEIRRADIINEPLVFFREEYAPGMWHIILDGIYGTDREHKISHLEPDESLMIAAVAAGAGISLITRPAAEMLKLHGVALKRLDPCVFVPLDLIWRTDNASRSLAAFVDIARAFTSSGHPPQKLR
jgi:DNA-binding transcriptional LysR family regulator